MAELHIHERINNVLSILDRMTLTGFQQFNAVSTVMKELAALDRDVASAEKAEEKPDEQESKAD